MTEYIAEIQRQFVTVYGFKQRADTTAVMTWERVPDGVYPMMIDGRVDYVRIENGFIYCCNFTEKAVDIPPSPV